MGTTGWIPNINARPNLPTNYTHLSSRRKFKSDPSTHLWVPRFPPSRHINQVSSLAFPLTQSRMKLRVQVAQEPTLVNEMNHFNSCPA
jgi:hypothetical protein